jgi:hypothetical protein
LFWIWKLKSKIQEKVFKYRFLRFVLNAFVELGQRAEKDDPRSSPQLMRVQLLRLCGNIYLIRDAG